LWDCSSVNAWAELAPSSQQTSLSAAADPTVGDNPTSSDSFRSTLILTYLATHQSDGEHGSDIKRVALRDNPAKHDLAGRYAHTQFDLHAYTALQHTPIRSLLIVSGESWLFGKKLENEDEFHAAKTHLREWVDSGKALTALWHATALLRVVFRVGPEIEVQSGSEKGIEDGVKGMLHEQWCIYIAALVCWACTFDESVLTGSFAGSSIASTSFNSPVTPAPTFPTTATSSSAPGYPPLLDSLAADAELRTFLQTMDVDEISALQPALAKVKRQTRAMLEAVRTKKINGSLGGLLDEAGGVLYRLVEGRSMLSTF
jgi:hypothetical protein